ncbi:MAG: hypothetical protein WCY19_04575 [Candidatus Gastranaerophilaceae bacterium]
MKILKCLALSSLVVLGACRGPLKQTQKASDELVHIADSLVEATHASLPKNVTKIYSDTIKITGKELKNTADFMEELAFEVRKGNRTERIGTPPNQIYLPKYGIITPVVEKGIYTNKKGTKYYIPIAGYAEDPIGYSSLKNEVKK